MPEDKELNTPKEPVEREEKNRIILCCPHCGKPLMMFNRCQYCGQMILWYE